MAWKCKFEVSETNKILFWKLSERKILWVNSGVAYSILFISGKKYLSANEHFWKSGHHKENYFLKKRLRKKACFKNDLLYI